jgi:hypothetical protein
MNNKTLIKALNSIDDIKRFQIITISDKKIIDDKFLNEDDLADYNAMLAYDHGDFESINREES